MEEEDDDADDDAAPAAMGAPRVVAEDAKKEEDDVEEDDEEDARGIGVGLHTRLVATNAAPVGDVSRTLASWIGEDPACTFSSSVTGSMRGKRRSADDAEVWRRSETEGIMSIIDDVVGDAATVGVGVVGVVGGNGRELGAVAAAEDDADADDEADAGDKKENEVVGVAGCCR